MSEKVTDVRRQIDQLDNKIHDLLMKRANLVLKIGEEKRKNNIQVVQPDREIIMLRRLMKRHEGPLPRQAVVRIWRELVGAVSMLQTGLKAVVTVPEDHTGILYWDMAKDYFSSVLPISKVSNALAAISMVREGEASFAVMPWPLDDEINPWWAYLMDEQSDRPMRIFARLPLADKTENEPAPPMRALAIGRLKFEDSGADRSFIMLDLPQNISRARIIDRAEALSLKALGLDTAISHDPSRKFHILEVDGYIADDDKVLAALKDSFDTPNVRVACLGGYPVPPVYEHSVASLDAKKTGNTLSKKSA